MHCFLNEKSHIVHRLLTEVEVSAPGIAEEGYAGVGIVHAEGEGRVDAAFPPLIFALYHQCGYAVDIACAAPLHVSSAVAAKVGAWSIAVV